MPSLTVIEIYVRFYRSYCFFKWNKLQFPDYFPFKNKNRISLVRTLYYLDSYQVEYIEIDKYELEYYEVI